MNKLLSFYGKYGAKLILVGWVIFTFICGFATYLTHGQSNTISCIFIVSLCGWCAILLYWLFNHIYKHNLKDINIIYINNNRKRLIRILDIIYFCLISVLLWILQIYDVRPVLYYVLITISLGILVLSILLTKHKNPIFNMLKIVIFSALSSMAVFKQFYLAGLIDIGYFAALNEVTASLGYIPEGLAGKQMLCPLNHLIIAMTKLLTLGDIKIATICAVVIPSILITIAIYAIAKHFIGVRYGLIAMLVVNILAYVIYLRYQANPTEWSWIYFVFLLFCIFIWAKNKFRVNSTLFIIMIVSLIIVILAHQFGSFIVLFLLFGIYLASIFNEGKIFTKMMIPFMVYSSFLLFWWCINPSSGIGFVLAIIGIGLSHTPESTESTIPTESIGSTTSTDITSNTVSDVSNVISSSQYVGIDPPLIFELAVTEISIVIILSICLILPLLLLASKNLKTKKDDSYLHYIIISLISGLAFFTIIYIFYTGMTIRIGCFIAIFFSLGLSSLFAYFAKCIDTDIKKVIHNIAVVCIICIIGFVNIAAPMINDDTQLWRKDYTITAEQTVEDVVSSEFITSYIPIDFSLNTDYVHWGTVDGYMSVKKILEGRKYNNNISKNSGQLTLLWDPSSYEGNTYILLREKILSSPSLTKYKYGLSELESFTQVGYINQRYKEILDGTSHQLYSCGGDYMYYVI